MCSCFKIFSFGVLICLVVGQFGQQIRLLLEYTGAEYEDRKFSGEDWFEVKYKMGFDFPNLPFYVDGEIYCLVRELPDMMFTNFLVFFDSLICIWN